MKGLKVNSKKLSSVVKVFDSNGNSSFDANGNGKFDINGNGKIK